MCAHTRQEDEPRWPARRTDHMALYFLAALALSFGAAPASSAPALLSPHDYTAHAPAPPPAVPHQLLEWKGNPKMCLSGPSQPGVFTVSLATCNATNKAQQWTRDLASQYVVNGADSQCLNAVQTGAVTLVACTPGLMDVQWTYSKTGELLSGSTNFCLTVKGTAITQASCSATAKADLWTWKNVTHA